jgi:hypothetical protein
MRLLILALLPLLPVTAASPAPPVRGLHLMAPAAGDMPIALRFIKEGLPKEGVNVLVLEFDYRYQFVKHPEVAESDSLSADDVQRLAAACKEAGVRLIPEIDLLGHQSWEKATWGLLRAHPEFDETPGKYPLNQGIYCRSYCPLHPQVHEVIFDLMDELADAAGADAFHVGMDEVFLLGEDDCPRCKGKDKAELFAGEVVALHDHLAKSKRTMWMWGDRLLDGESTGIGKWEASQNNTHRAIALIPRDVVVCDWHYEQALPTPEYFAIEGFPVLACPWRKPEVALTQLETVARVRSHANDVISSRMQGVLHTTWTGIGPFARAYFGEPNSDPQPATNVLETLACFRALFSELRALEGR